MLPVKRKVLDIPVFFHYGFHLHHYPCFSAETIPDDLRGIDDLGIRNIQLTGEIKFGIVVQKPKPETGSVFFIVKINIVDADHVGAHFDRVRLGKGGVRNCQAKNQTDPCLFHQQESDPIYIISSGTAGADHGIVSFNI